MYIQSNSSPLASPCPSLQRQGLLKEPIAQLQQWLEEATKAEIPYANAMVLATATDAGVPSSRSVLLKQLDSSGLVFFTNYKSKKARELAENPFASATFFWHELLRQVTAQGEVTKISTEESATYFATRTRESQLSAWASEQDSPISNYAALERALAVYQKRFEGREVPLPENWGGYRLKPTKMEFWQGRAARLHDRFCYTAEKGGVWKIERLSP